MTHPTPNVETTQSNIEKALCDALKSVLEKDGHSDPRTCFYNKFQEEVTEHDEDLQRRHDEDLNTTLIFSGLFSAVTSAFIIDIQSELKPDYEEMNNTLLELLLNATIGNVPPGQPVSLPRWTGPDPSIRRVQAILYTTLCATLFAAFMATLGKQWLNRYRQADTHGSVEDRCRDRERKLNGIDRWRFHIVMQLAPLTVQGSLGLLGSALSRYLWEVDRTVSSVVIGFTSVGFVLYVAIVAASVTSLDCPFHTPLSLVICSISDTVKLWWSRRDSQGQVLNLQVAMDRIWIPFTAPLYVSRLQMYHSLLSPSWKAGYNLDSRCITRMLGMSTNDDTFRITMDFVQDITWDPGIKSAPLGWIYRKLMNCFDTTYGAPILNPKLRDIAYISAKAFAFIHIQQRRSPRSVGSTQCMGNGWRPDEPHKPFSPPAPCSDPDPELTSALLMVNKALGYSSTVTWDNYRSLTPAHHLWMSHLFVYYAWHDRLPDDVTMFLQRSLHPDRHPSQAVIADCLYIIAMLLNIDFLPDDLARWDKSHKMNALVEQIFSKLSAHFSSNLFLDGALLMLQFVAQVRTTAVATRGYQLFETIMNSTAEQEEKMKAAHLALHTAYPPGLESVPSVQDPRLILDFLRSYIDPNVRRDDDAISLAVHAINSASDNPTSRSWTWRIENAGELLTWFEGQPHVEELNWWHRILWLHYGGLDSNLQDRMDKIARNGDGRVDLKQCRIAIEREIERVVRLGATPDVVTLLEAAHVKLCSFISEKETPHS